jgi:replicative DNA helicase
MCHVAAGNLSQGQNVLYITMEMAEEKIAERIDANLLNIDLDELRTISKEDYTRKFSALKAKTQGKLIIKEYPTAGASVLHFRALLNDLALKKNFRPDIIFIDYLNICCSARIKPGANVNSYSYIKAIAEELRGLAVEFGLPVVSATQTTRSGFSNSDPGLEDTSESFGLPATADFMFALVSNEELEALGQILVKQLKNRYGDPNLYKRFVLGIDRAKMRLYDVEESAQQDIADAGIPDKPINTFGNRERRKDFGGLKV